MADESEPGHDTPLWYFAYGSNLHRSTFIDRRQMQPLESRWGWLAGYRLCFNIPIGPGERGVANIDAVIVGRALYTGAVRLADAIRVGRGE